MEKRRVITNDSDRLMLVFTEIFGEDYWLRPGEAVEVVAKMNSPDDDFIVKANDRGVTVWPGGDMHLYIAVWQGEEQLPCGYQRPLGWA